MQGVEYNRPTVLGVGIKDGNLARDIKLVAGYNELSDEDWKLFSDHPTVKILIELGDITPVKSKPGSETIITALSQDEAVKLVRETHNLQLLKKWAKTEKRPLVLHSISNKLNDMVLPERRAKVLGDLVSAGETETTDLEDQHFGPAATEETETTVPVAKAPRSRKGKR